MRAQYVMTVNAFYKAFYAALFSCGIQFLIDYPCIWIQERLYNFKKHLCNASQAPPSPVATSVLTEINMPLNGALKKKKKKKEVLMLEFPVSRTGQARQKCICKVMKYWVCFDYELALTSLASCELAEILMRWNSFLFIRVLLVCHISGLQQRNCLGKKKALQSRTSWPELTPQCALSQLVYSGETGMDTAPFRPLQYV